MLWELLHKLKPWGMGSPITLCSLDHFRLAAGGASQEQVAAMAVGVYVARKALMARKADLTLRVSRLLVMGARRGQAGLWCISKEGFG